jgi:hypothetical protein
MFERGSGEAAHGPIAVEITLEDGQLCKGKLILPPGQSLPQALNGQSSFIEFEAIGGARMYIAKSALCSVKPTIVPAAPTLRAGGTEGGDFNPYVILGVRPGSSYEEARDAYLRLAKTYHPDRYAASELPREVREYLAAMARRINAAYDALEAEQKREADKAEPVFTKAGRG